MYNNSLHPAGIIISSRGPEAFGLVEGRLSELRKSPPKYFTDYFQVSLRLPGLRGGVPGQMKTLGLTPLPPPERMGDASRPPHVWRD